MTDDDRDRPAPPRSRLSDTSALVTGGASGLGQATARALLDRGARVVLLDRDEERGRALAQELGDAVAFCPGDVTRSEDVERAIDRARERAPLRVAVNCAGVGGSARTVNRDGKPFPLDRFERVITVNLVGTFNVLRLAAAAMASQEIWPSAPGDSDSDGDRDRGVIINTASVAAFDGQIGQVAYASSKAGIVGMTLPAARDLAVCGVRVMTIAPGTFDTPMLAGIRDKARDALSAAIPFPRRLGRPAEYAALAVHIAENAYLNGEVIRLDGALRMAPR